VKVDGVLERERERVVERQSSIRQRLER
jgi:hypothetical protein